MKRRSPETIAREVLGVGPRYEFEHGSYYKLGCGRDAVIADAVNARRLLRLVAAAIRADRKQRKGAKR